MNVIHLTTNVFGKERGFVGGAERYVYELARHMAELVPTRLLAFENVPHTETVGRLTVKTLRPACYVGSPWNPLSFAMLSDLKWADVIHCHQYKTCVSSTAAAFARLSGRRVYATDLGGAGLDISSYISTDTWYHGHLHLSAFSRKLARHENSARSHVIYGGVALDLFYPDVNTTRDGQVLFVGRVLPHKGIDVLIRALPDGMRLRVVGQEVDNAYMELLQRLSSGKQVTFVHNATDKDLLLFYRQALCVVLPSVHKTVFGRDFRSPELLGQTVLEGMACNTPGICSNAASLPELIRNGETGFVVPWGDVNALREKLIWFRDHPAETERMGAAAGADVRERFNWNQVAKRCLEIYQR